GGAVETQIVAGPVARQRQFLVREERRHNTRAGLVGVFGDPPHQRQRRHRRRHQQVLAFPQLQADPDRDFGEAVEPYRIDRGGEIALASRNADAARSACAAIDPRDARYKVSEAIHTAGGARPKSRESFVREGLSGLIAKASQRRPRIQTA
ncbi:hypothetical protein KXV85_003912, partial [Aspergillus fumigatus]